MTHPVSKSPGLTTNALHHITRTVQGKLHNPALILIVSLVLTMGVIGWLGWSMFASYNVIRMILPENERLYELRGEIIYLDEVLTMSARLAATTGDLAWEERYLSFVPQLDTVIKEAISAAPETVAEQVSAKTDTANIQLVDMEMQAFEAVKDGRAEDAQAILFSDEYNQYKATYADGTQELLDYLQQRAVDQQQRVQRRAWITFTTMLVVFPVLIILWAWVLRYLQMSIAFRDRLIIAQTREQEMEEVQKTQEILIAERTASLQEALQTVEQREAALEQTVAELRTSQNTVRELSAPIIPVLPGVLVAPLIGALDSARATTFQTNVLRMVEQWRAHAVLFDITGVPVVDTQVSQVLIDTADAVRLLGANVALVGIRPEVAQTVVALGVDLRRIHTYPNLQAAVQTLLQNPGQKHPIV